MILPIVFVSYVFLILPREIEVCRSRQSSFYGYFLLYGRNRICAISHNVDMNHFACENLSSVARSRRATIGKMVATFHWMEFRHSQARYSDLSHQPRNSDFSITF